MRRTVLLSLAIFTAACARTAVGALAVSEPCSGHVCQVEVINHSSSDLTLKYADSTGRREHVGLARSGDAKAFKVQYIHSAGIRIFATKGDGRIYAADVGFEPLRRTNVHFPDDFREVADTLMPVRQRSSNH